MGELRWTVAGDEPQQVLFADEELVERHVGRGQYRGLEFLHVNARRIINEVPKTSRVPFRYTINAYRGCSHACSYCLAGDTMVLMGDGRTRAIADIRPGDEVYGTRFGGGYRRYVRTPVLAHWSTVEEAYRVSLHDGTQLVSSGVHRYLTKTGWKFVAGSEPKARHRPHLTTGDALVGTGAAALSPGEHPAPRGEAVGSVAGLRVAGVERLGVDLEMFDITTGTGDFVANGVVSHNCFARPTHDYLGLGIGEDFERKLVVKVNAVERLRAELRSPKWGGEHIAMGTNTDPYQRCEGKYHLTRGIVTALGEAANPFSILTKSTLILRDLDVLGEAAARTQVSTSFSIGTLDEAVWKASEPGTPHPRRRVEAVARLNAAGIPCSVLVAPVLPGLSDAPEQLAEVVEACVQAGATSISPIALHLRPGVRDHFMGWLRQHHPGLVDEYERRYRGAYLPGADQDALGALVRGLVAAARGRRAPGAPARPRPATRPGARPAAPREKLAPLPPEAPAHQLGFDL